MPRRSRRARRRSAAGLLILLGVLAAGTVILVAGLSRASSQSDGYHTSTDRSLAALGGVVADQSNVTSGQVNKLRLGLRGDDRPKLQAGLDDAVNQTSSESAHAVLDAGTAAPGTLAGDFATVFEDRARAMSEVRAAVDGLLGMHPLPASGAPGTDAPGSPPVPISATDATNRIVAAGALLSHADQLYASVRTSLARAPGHARLPRSVWVPDRHLWQPEVVGAQVDQLSTSPSLQSTHQLVLRTMRVDPPALPAAPSTPPGTSVLSPTTRLGVAVVVADEGTMDEAHATVRFALASPTPGESRSLVRTAPVVSGASVTLPEVTFPVKPGTTYVLTLSIVLPTGQTDTAGTATQQTLQIAPAT